MNRAQIAELAAGIRGEAEALQDALFSLLSMATTLEAMAESGKKERRDNICNLTLVQSAGDDGTPAI